MTGTVQPVTAQEGGKECMAKQQFSWLGEWGPFVLLGGGVNASEGQSVGAGVITSKGQSVGAGHQV